MPSVLRPAVALWLAALLAGCFGDSGASVASSEPASPGPGAASGTSTASSTHSPPSTSVATSSQASAAPSGPSAPGGPSPYVPPPVPAAFQPFASAMESFMADRSIPAGQVAVAHEGRLLWTRGFGTMRADGSGGAVPEDAVFRIASITKPMTMAAVRQLARAGSLALSDPVFCMTPPQAGCHLSFEAPAGKVPDPRLALVTVQHLLDHAGGWDASASGDPMFMAIEIAQAMGVPSPPDQKTVARYMMGKLLDFTPGTGSAYSNFGYMLLGLVVEQVAGKDYLAYLKGTVMGDPAFPIQLGHTLPARRDAKEPEYKCLGKAPNVFAPTEKVCWPDGGWHLENMEAHGGLVASASTVARFLAKYRISGEVRDPRETGWSYTFFGSLDGTFGMARQRPDNLDVVVLFNDRGGGAVDAYASVRETMDAAADAYMDSRG